MKRLITPVLLFLCACLLCNIALAVGGVEDNSDPAIHIGANEACTRGQFATFLYRMAGSPTPKNPNNPFEDISPNDHCYNAVLWMVESNLMSGTSASKFTPELRMTRAPVVTVLWRFFDTPEPITTKNPFTDVNASSYYYKAVLWAVEEGISNGLSETIFGPDETCTRGQVITFFWNIAGKPNPETINVPYVDVNPGDYYYDAVLWAVEEGLIDDTDITATEHTWDFGKREEPTCTTPGLLVYACNRCCTTRSEEIPPIGHSYTESTISSTCTADGFTIHTCNHCGDSYITDILPATGHSYGEKITPPTCTATGVKICTCITCGDIKAEDLPPLGHSYEGKVTSPTCTNMGYTTYSCSYCGDSYIADLIPATGHSYEEKSIPPTCTNMGYTAYTCILCGHNYSSDIMPLLGHNYVEKVTDPTCTEIGRITYVCSYCEHSYVAGFITALGHDYVAKITDPTCTKAGLTTYTCSRCRYNYATDAVPATGHSFTKGTCTVCGEEEPNSIPTNPFVDVKEADYFYAPVLWAVKNQITNGLSATTFGPEKPCTRGQVVTFLWRASGSPEPTKTHNPFSDVKSNAYYYKAVLWAVEEGITTGISATTFGPDKTCTRGQVATFLWRAQGKPAPTNTTNPFSDIAETEYYYTAILWAVEEGITNGTGKGRFSPNSDCTRGQIVTFLYRAMV